MIFCVFFILKIFLYDFLQQNSFVSDFLNSLLFTLLSFLAFQTLQYRAFIFSQSASLTILFNPKKVYFIFLLGYRKNEAYILRDSNFQSQNTKYIGKMAISTRTIAIKFNQKPISNSVFSIPKHNTIQNVGFCFATFSHSPIMGNSKYYTDIVQNFHRFVAICGCVNRASINILYTYFDTVNFSCFSFIKILRAIHCVPIPYIPKWSRIRN